MGTEGIKYKLHFKHSVYAYNFGKAERYYNVKTHIRPLSGDLWSAFCSLIAFFFQGTNIRKQVAKFKTSFDFYVAVKNPFASFVSVHRTRGSEKREQQQKVLTYGCI